MLIARLATLPVLLLGASDGRQVGCARFAFDGDIGVAASSTTAEAVQDVTTAFGLGDDHGIPCGRSAFDMGVPTLTVSGIVFAEGGTGAPTRSFVGNPLLLAGANASSGFDPSDAKASLVLDISSEPVTVSRGLAADDFDFDLEVTHGNGFAPELVEREAPVPMGVLRAAGGMAEIGSVEADVDEVETGFVDIDVMLTVRATDVLDLLVGYRSLAIDGDGLIDDDSFLADITIDGIVLGCGVRF